MANIKILLLVTLAALCTSFTDGGHFITDPKVRKEVEKDFKNRMEFIGTEKALGLVSFTENPELSSTEKEALYFLLAYSPLCDIADCEPDYFLQQARGAFRAREYFSWGPSVPEDIFRHFVLPHRVNNENLDDARDVFFEELKDRIKGMSMYDAALEVNHWCHEKVEYRATDPRTSAPLALVKTSWGRCGEESAFTATALRAVGIPARQVYTPRWVHTDSNHAWVEVWIDGKWHYLGACEPEPQLDMAWFTSPATRAMMMHTTVFGKYRGPEEVSMQTDLYTTINLLEIYAPKRKIAITVHDEEGHPVSDAQVKFKVYNYSEFYPIATKTTGTDGKAELTTGAGDIFVWAVKGGDYGYVKLPADKDETTIIIKAYDRQEYSEDFIINVPPEQPLTAVSTDKVAENRRRLTEEDSIRNTYMSTFPHRQYALSLAGETGLDAENTWRFLQASQGNWQEIESFIRSHKCDPHIFPFLESLYEKDLRDTPSTYLSDHILAKNVIPSGVPEELIADKILSPRIAMEIISPWRSYLREVVVETHPEFSDPLEIVGYVNENIRVDATQNYVACLLTPKGVHETKMADERSRNVYFVALCRTAGIPAHIDKATGKPQFYINGTWHDAVFGSEIISSTVQPMGRVVITSPESNRIVPAYRSHFTLARYEDGDFTTLDLAGELSGRMYPAGIEIPAGYYRYTVGSRANDGSVAVHTEYFNITPNETKELQVALPDVNEKLFVEGILDMNTIIFLADGSKTTLKEQSNGRGLILAFADPAGEPTRHILQEMPSYRESLENWGGGILFVQPTEVGGASLNQSIFTGIPSQAIWLPDTNNALLNSAIESLRLEFSNEYPITLYLNTSGGILFSNKGYRIGIVESLWKTISAEREMMDKKK